MPFADKNGIKIYYQVEGRGLPILFHHWSFATLEEWYDFGYVTQLKSDFRLILMDARGNGRSDKSYLPSDYTLIKRIEDIVAVLDDVGVNQAVYFGFSLGAWIAYGISKYAKGRFNRFILGGSHPYPQNLSHLRHFAQIGITGGPDKFISAWQDNFRILTPKQKGRIQSYDFPALLAGAPDREDLTSLLPGIDIPCLFFCGDSDPVFPLLNQSMDKIQHADFFLLPGKNHGNTMNQTNKIVSQIRKFLKKINSNRIN